MQELLSFFDALFKDRNYGVSMQSWHVLQPISRSFQTNAIDCGVFVCAYALCRSTQAFNFFDFTASDIPRIRKEIKQQLADVHDE